MKRLVHKKNMKRLVHKKNMRDLFMKIYVYVHEQSSPKSGEIALQTPRTRFG